MADRVAGQHELVMDNTDVDVRIYHSCEQIGFVPLHWHRHIEIVLVLEGEVTFNYENQEVVLHPNDFIAIGSSVLHSSTNTENKSVVLQIPVQFLAKYWPDPELLSFNVHPQNLSDEYQTIVTNLKALLDVYTTKDTGYRLKFNEYLMSCLHTILLNYAHKSTVLEIGEDQHFKELLIYINQAYCEKLNVANLATKFHYHPDYLSRYFKKKANMTLSRYIYLIRLSHVYREIMTTETTVKDVFMKNGISNLRLGTKLFEEYYGASPRQVRKSAQ
ncbi:MAG: AraC family transcriptional regulator [Lactobacillaceae bacterium]|jgi:AraC-like DNA-binding protein/mannose-6-phosphate isomerase-like protein (cupin superfamily)|nr:AraC family transcriptional regulator [Lactobacillaceae bacterium]